MGVNRKKQLFIITWSVGLIVIILGLNGLHDIFANESQNARSDLAAQRNALSKFALKSLRQNLHNRLKFSQVNIDRIAADPLVPDRGLLMVQEGKQILPRPIKPLQQTFNPAMQLYHWIKDIDPLDLIIEQASPWEQRLNLLSNFKLAIDSKDNEEIRWAFRAIRENRTLGNISAERDIPFTLAVVDFFIQESNPSKQMLQGVVRDGSIIEQEHDMAGLQRSLLRHRNRFTQQDFIFMRDRILELSKYVNVTYADFLQQSNNQTQLINVGNITNASIGLTGNWYVEPSGGEDVLGIPIDIAQVIAEIRQEMLLLELITAEDTLTIGKNGQEFIQINQIDLDINSNSWLQKNEDISELYWLKTSLLTAIAMLLIIITALTGLIYYRKNHVLSLKSDFISTVSHELKTPLASLRLLTETLNRKGIDSKKTQNYPVRMVKVIDDLNLLVENILSFNRLSKGSWDAKLELMSIKECILELRFEFKQYSKAAENGAPNIIIDQKCFDDITINADPELVKILFRNLINNSIKYNDSNNTVISISTIKNDMYVINYQDNGIGIPENHRNNVFTEFTRYVDESRSITGTGLGLSICRKIMDLHNGSITIVSNPIETNKQRGTCFKLCFPFK